MTRNSREKLHLLLKKSRGNPEQSDPEETPAGEKIGRVGESGKIAFMLKKFGSHFISFQKLSNNVDCFKRMEASRHQTTILTP